jgi:HEAT repeat protein
MRTVSIVLLAAATAFADAKLDATLEKVAKYDYDQGRQVLIDLEAHMRGLPAAEVEKRFLEFLRSNASIAGKDFICRQLSLIGSETSVPALEGMLASADTVEMARYALERIPGPATATALRNAFAKAPEKARPGIINTLAIKRDAQAVPLAAKLVEANDKALASAAIAALGRIATPPALNTLAALRKQGVVAAMEASLEAADLLSGAAGTRASAVTIYRELNVSTVPPTIHVGALLGLSKTLAAESLPLLTAAMKDSNAHVQASAIRFLNSIPGPEATVALQSGLTNLAAPARVRILTALAHRGDRAAVPAIVKAAKDSDATVRAAALTGIGVIGDPASVGLLAAAAASDASTDAEKAAARMALDRMRGDGVDTAIIAAISSSQGKEKTEFIRAAGERGAPESANALLVAARDNDRDVKRESFRALRETAGAGQVSSLLAMLTSSTSEADRRECGTALSAALRRSPARNADVVAAYKSASAPEVKASLLQVMGQAGAKDSLPVIKGALEDSSPDLVRAAILALTEWPDDQPLSEMLAFAGRAQNPTHRVLSLRAVLKIMDQPTQRPLAESVTILANVMKLAQNPEEKRGALALLMRFPTKEAVALAEAAEADPTLTNEAKAALQRLRRAVR